MSATIVLDDGDYGAVIVSGSNLRIAPQSLDQQWRGLQDARILILPNEVPETVNIAAAVAARRDGARVVLNAAPARPMSSDLLEQVDVLAVNRVEAARRLKRPRRAVIVTFGGQRLVPHDGEPVWIAPIKVEVVSTHGAGDCFVGALAAQLAAGDSLGKAARTANFAAARLVGRLDA